MDEKKILKQLDNVKTDMDKLLKRYYDSSENGVIGIIDKVNTAVETVNENSAKITENTTKIEENSQKIETNTTNIATNTENIATNTTTLADHTEQLRNHENAITAIGWTYRESISVRLNDLETKAIQASDNIDVLRDGLLTEEEQQEVTNTVHTEESKKRNEFLKIILPKIRAHVDSSTGEGTDYSAEIEAINSQIASINSKLSKIEIPTDPNYTGKTFTDYPAGTIIQTYDYDERKFNINSTTNITTPTLYFIAEQEANSTIKIYSKIKVLLPATLTIKTFLNKTQIEERVVEVTTDTEQDYYFEYTGQALNTESKANEIYQTIVYSGSNNTMFLTYLKTEVIAPNACFLNKLCPFNAYCVNGEYLLTDCSSGTLKIANIPVNEIKNINSVTWTDTQIPALECYMEYTFTKNSDGTFTPDILQYFIRSTDHNMYALDPNNFSTQTLLNNVNMFDTVTQGNSFVMFTCSMKNKKSMENYVYYPETKNLVSMSTKLTSGDYFMFFGSKLYNNNTTNIPTIYGTAVTKTGDCSYGSILRDTNRWQLHSGTNVTMRYYDFVENTNYHANLYIKYYDKMLKTHIKQYNSTVTIIETTEFGNHDKVFEMPNNDYFAVKDNKFYYYKLQDTETTEENS